MQIKEVVATLERFAPLPLQEDYDNAGLQIGVTETEVSGVLLCLDVTEDVLRETVRQGCNTVIAHHPLLFRAVKSVTDATYVGRCIRLAVRHDLTVYAAHTNLDNAPGGVNFEMARRLGLEEVRFLQPFRRPGGLEGGSGVIGRLPRPVEAGAFLRQVKQAFRVAALSHNALLGRPVERVALCGGAGAFLADVALAAGADAFLTGEMSYHHYFGYDGRMQLAVAGHYETEQFTVDLMHRLLAEAHPGLRIAEWRDTNPVHYL